MVSTSSSSPAKTAAAASSSSASNQSPVYFWRETDPQLGYLLQWYSSQFVNPTDPDIVYTSAEQYMMYQKALLFSDIATAEMILEIVIPKEQKSLGRLVSNFEDKKWAANRERIVEDGNWFKFTSTVVPDEGVQLRKLLQETGDRELVEASPRDRIWGVGFGEKNAGKYRGKWGLNLLGKAIVKVRARIREDQLIAGN